MAAIVRASQRVLNCGGGGAKLWAEITALGQLPGVVDLGQGYPDFEGNSTAFQGAHEALGIPRMNQYSPIPGTNDLTTALAGFYERKYGRKINPRTEVCVMASATEAIYAAIMGLVNPGEEVVIFEPYFPWYLPHVKLAEGVAKVVTLKPPHFQLERKELESVFSDKTKLVLFNTPHNPTGHVATKEELEMLAELCIKHDVVAISDEVYECVTFGEKKHLRLADIPGMESRTLTVGSASKLFSLTGWRVGWIMGPEDLVTPSRTVHAYASFCAPTPLQQGVALALNAPEETSKDYFSSLSTLMHENHTLLSSALTELGLDVCPVDGGYFLLANVRKTGMTAIDYCKWLVEHKKVACTPLFVFYTPKEEGAEENYLLRFAICKKRETIEKACEFLRK